MKIELTKSEREFCKYIAGLRNSANRKVTDANPAGKTINVSFAEQEGVMSELAFCKMMNIFPQEALDVSTRSVSKGEDNGDATINGYNIDVKATKVQSGQLLSRNKNPNVDLIVLMLGVNGCYRLGGGMWSDDLYQPWRFGLNTEMPIPCYSALQDELLSPRQLLSVLGHTF